MKIGVLPLARSTFDVDFATECFEAARASLRASGHQLIGSKRLLFDAGETERAIATIAKAGVDRLLILQVTFTDAATTLRAADAVGPEVPLSIWAIPEPRLGGRLRLNAFCGLNLASHALSRAGRPFLWAYEAPAGEMTPALTALLSEVPQIARPEMTAPGEAGDEGRRLATAISGKRIARLGAHPDGFDTCHYSAEGLRALAGVEVDEFGIDTLFNTARAIEPGAVTKARREAGEVVTGLDEVNAEELDRSLRLRAALDVLRGSGDYDAFAIRCWPETFTEYGGAVCGPAAMMGEKRVPCACEADVVGALTQLALMEAADAPVFLTDIVDMDANDDTGVVWHCGQAPASMKAPEVEGRATIHTNRRMPLLFEFPLKPGAVTLVRISQAFNETTMVIGFGEMLDRPMAFTGTSGVLRFAGGTDAAARRMMASGLEHHMALAYGDHRQALRNLAAALGLPVLELTA